jgi:lactoylglutathione lyase
MSNGPLIRKIDCLALHVTDLDAALGFYNSLGQEVVWRTPTAAGLRLPDTDGERVLQTERPGPEIDLTVEEVGPAIERFIAAGGRVMVEPFDIPIGRCAVVVDPWENQLVLLDNSKGHLVTDQSGNIIGLDS